MQYAEYKKIPNRLRKCRIARNMRPEVVAEIMGLKYTSQLSQWESGKTVPALVNVFKLAGVYKVFVEDLYYDTWDKIRNEVTLKAQEVFERRRLEGRPISTEGAESLAK